MCAKNKPDQIYLHGPPCSFPSPEHSVLRPPLSDSLSLLLPAPLDNGGRRLALEREEGETKHRAKSWKGREWEKGENPHAPGVLENFLRFDM